jgi:CheY-like chemotaxis protein
MPNTRNLVGMNVLVVEDEFMVRHVIVAYLQELGCIVREASSGEEAIAQLDRGERIDMVFTDIRLGGSLDGWDVAEAFRAAHSSMPIVYTSGYATSPARPVPGSLYLPKPYHPADILNVCARFAPEAKPH